MACCRRCACAFAMVDSSLGAYCHTCRLLFVLDVMAQSYRLVMPFRPLRWCAPYTAPSPSGALRLHVAALGRGQRLRVTGFGPLALVGTQLAEALQFVRVCPYGPTA